MEASTVFKQGRIVGAGRVECDMELVTNRYPAECEIGHNKTKHDIASGSIDDISIVISCVGHFFKG